MGIKWFLLLFSLTTVTCEITQVDLRVYNDYVVPDLRFVCLNYNITANISQKCSEQLEIVCANTTLLMTMLDASSKFPYTGLGYASRMDYGNYDQCMTVDHTYEGGRILGKHCPAGLLIPDFLGNITDPDSFFKLAVCKPDQCTANDFNIIASTFIEDFPPLFQDIICSTKETGKDVEAVDIVTFIIFAIVILLMIVSTIYDIYIYKMEIKSHHPLFLAFSVFTNGKKLLHVSKKTSKEQINTFHGLRVISMMWIVAGHGFAAWPSISVINKEDVDTWQSKRYAGYIATAPLAVDTFFFISGFLLAFHYLKQKAKPLGAQVKSIPHMYIHRYLRLTPALLMLWLVTISSIKFLGTGPLWNYIINMFSRVCKDRWWPYFLYIQNYYNYDDLCLTQTWYLSADMQMFLLSPLILIPLALHLKNSNGFKITMVELLILNVICTAIPMVIKLVFQDYTNPYDTHSRLINYFIGMMLAVFMRVKIDKPFLYMINNEYKSKTNLAVWIIILLGMLATVICYQEVEMNHGYESRSVFYSLMRPAWCIGLSWIVYSCYHGYGGVVDFILTNSMMQVLSKFTYCMYLIHVLTWLHFIGNKRLVQYFSDYVVFYEWCGTYIVTLVASLFWTLAFETPIIIIEKYFTGKDSSPRLQNGNPETNKTEYPQSNKTESS